MQRVLRFGIGWLAAATVAVGVSWAVIRDAVEPGGLRGSASGSSSGSAAGPSPGPAAGSAAGPATGSAAAPQPALGAGPAFPSTRPASSGAPTHPSSVPSSSVSRRASPPVSPASAIPTASASPGSPTPGAGTGAASATATSAVRSYLVTGGRVVLQLTASRARLVSATPDTGYRVQSWDADGWLRVDFSLGGTTRSSVFATWNGTPPNVRTVEY